MSEELNIDCAEMKRQIQEKMYEVTKDMSYEEYEAYISNRIRNGRFAKYFLESEDERVKKAV